MITRLRHRQYRAWLLYAVLVGASLVILTLRARYLRHERERPFGRLNAEQVMQLSLSICQTISPSEQTLSLSVMTDKGPSMRCWDVQCRNAAGKQVADLTWEANTGQLSRVGAFPPYHDDPDKSLLTAQQAVRCAYSWLHILQRNAPSLRWFVVRPPLCAARQSWDVALQAAGHHARIQMQAHSGNLLLAEFWAKAGK